MKLRRIEQGNPNVPLVDQKTDFRAAQDDPLGAVRGEILDNLKKRLFRRGFDLPAAQLGVNDVIDNRPLVLGRHDHFETVLARQSLLVETLLHREFRSQQAHLPKVFRLDGFARCIGNMYQRNRDIGLHPVCELVHRVGANHQNVRPGLLYSSGRPDQQLCRGVPVSCELQRRYLCKIQGNHDDLRRMKTAELFTDKLVDDAVIFEGRLPAHPTDKPDRFHCLSAHVS